MTTWGGSRSGALGSVVAVAGSSLVADYGGGGFAGAEKGGGAAIFLRDR